MRFFIRRYQLMLYIFTHRKDIISTFIQFIGGLLTTSNLTFLYFKYVIAINPYVVVSLYIYDANLLFYEVINGFVLSYAFQTNRTRFILCSANHFYPMTCKQKNNLKKCTTIVFLIEWLSILVNSNPNPNPSRQPFLYNCFLG